MNTLLPHYYDSVDNKKPSSNIKARRFLEKGMRNWLMLATTSRSCCDKSSIASMLFLSLSLALSPTCAACGTALSPSGRVSGVSPLGRSLSLIYFGAIRSLAVSVIECFYRSVLARMSLCFVPVCGTSFSAQ
jgi:hypothetical protein